MCEIANRSLPALLCVSIQAKSCSGCAESGMLKGRFVWKMMLRFLMFEVYS